MTDTTPTDPQPPTRRRVCALAVRAARITASHALCGIAAGAGSTAGKWLVWWLVNR